MTSRALFWMASTNSGGYSTETSVPTLSRREA